MSYIYNIHREHNASVQNNAAQCTSEQMKCVGYHGLGHTDAEHCQQSGENNNTRT